MISKTLEDIEKELKCIKEIANEEYFKRVEELCEEVNKRNNDLQNRIDKAINYIYTDLISEWAIEHGGFVSGSDLPADAITPLLDILKGEK